MTKGDEITNFAARHKMVILSIAELADYIQSEAGR
jgi:3,4-dihydroxy-2-butanone 4-phosphate synthase